MTDRNSSRGWLCWWVRVTAVAALAAACTSKQVPIGEQNGLGDSDGGASGGRGGAGSAGSGGGGGGSASTGGGGLASTGGGGLASTGAGGSVSTGGSGSGGALSSGGAPGTTGAGGGNDAGAASDAGSCQATFASAVMKDCATAADCALVRHFDCCGTVVTAIRRGTDASFASADQAFQACVPGCNVRGCDHADVAEDGNVIAAMGQGFAAQCRAGRCTSVVTTSTVCASDGDCGGGQICVAFVTNIGPTSSTQLECRGNPCGASPLSCTCASSACTGFFAGLCSVNGTRLTCDDGRQ